jgi:hypothetical protein
MNTTLQGTIERKDFGTGTWALVTDSGEVYELQKAPKNLLTPGTRVVVQGTIQPDAISIAMIGPILVVHTMERLETTDS